MNLIERILVGFGVQDLEQLRHHMQWIHKVKIHPKMIHNRPPLNCQKCQCRFFTDQGLERHLLGSHGLVTSSMQEAANRGQDGGRCPICGKVNTAPSTPCGHPHSLALSLVYRVFLFPGPARPVGAAAVQSD